MAKEFADWTFNEVVEYGAQVLLRRLIAADFKSFRDLAYPLVEMGVRYGSERAKRKEQENKP